MLRYPEPTIAKPLSNEQDPFEALDLERVLAGIRRQARLIAIFGIIGVVLGAAFVASTVPLYTSSADVLIDKRQPVPLVDMTDPNDAIRTDAEMGSQIELLQSNQMARAVVNRLNLTENAGFNADDSGVIDLFKTAIRTSISYVVGFITPGGISDDELQAKQTDKVRDAATQLVSGLGVARVEGSYVIRISYTSADPLLSASVANGYGAAYLDDQLQAKYDATRRASLWLQGRIGELKAQSQEADLAVQRYRNDSGLLSTGSQLVSEQQLGEINAQLISAEASRAESKARLDQLKGIIASGRIDAVVDDALASSTVNNLRSKYLDSSRREAEITRKLGANHAQSRRLRDEMDEYRRLMFSELSRIAESYESTYNVALRREQSLKESLDRVSGVSQDANTSGVKLRELQQEADTYRNLYNNFLQRYQEALQQQSFPVSDSRIITGADVPRASSYPNTKLLLALSFVLGLGVGSGVGAIREYRDRFFRTPSQARSELQLDYLGSLKKIKSQGAKSVVEERTTSSLWLPGSVNAYVQSQPFSAFAETLRNVKVAVDLIFTDKKSKIIGVVSSLPSEGKTVTSSNLASILALQGARVLLIDGDLRNPSLTRTLLKKHNIGLVEAVLGSNPLAECVMVDGSLSVLPASTRGRLSNSSDLLASPGMDKLLTEARTLFDYIIVDLPPIAAVVDAKAFAHRADGFLCVIEWGKTSRALVRNTLQSSAVIKEKCIGVVFNKEDEAQSRFYKSHDHGDYYSARYIDYHQG
jgi:succinoglycan biosynthesis transport protein ExoP